MIEWMWEYLRISKRYASPQFNLLITNTLILTHKFCMYLFFEKFGISNVVSLHNTIIHLFIVCLVSVKLVLIYQYEKTNYFFNLFNQA